MMRLLVILLCFGNQQVVPRFSSSLLPALLPVCSQVTDLTSLAAVLRTYNFQVVPHKYLPLCIRFEAMKKCARKSNYQAASTIYYEDPAQYIRVELLESGFYFVQTTDKRSRHYFERTNKPETPLIKVEQRVENDLSTSCVRDLHRVAEIIQKFIDGAH